MGRRGNEGLRGLGDQGWPVGLKLDLMLFEMLILGRLLSSKRLLYTFIYSAASPFASSEAAAEIVIIFICVSCKTVCECWVW